MALSLQCIMATLVVSIALIVAVTCVLITLLSSLNTLNEVGNAWADGMSTGVSSVTLDFITRAEGTMLAADTFAKEYAPMMPLDLYRETGKNWTQPWFNFLSYQARKLSYNFASLSVLFDDICWMYSGVSDWYQGANRIEWIETFDPAVNSTTGGIRYYINNGSLIPYDEKTNFNTEITYSGAFVRPQAIPDFNPVRFGLNSRATAAGVFNKAQCMWLPVSFGYYPEKSIFWEQFGACSITNQSSKTIGWILLSLGIDKNLGDIMARAPRSKNGHNFVIDANGYILATSYPVRFFEEWATGTLVNPPPAGCGNTQSQKQLPPRLGCLRQFNNYSYAPLGALNRTFVLTPNASKQELDVNGETYIAISKRVSSNRGLTFNLVNFVPKNDLLGGTTAGRNMAIGIACGILLFGAVATIVILYFTLTPLVVLAEKMTETSRLEGLDKDEVIQDDGKNGGDDKSSDAATVLDGANNNTLRLESQSFISEIAALEIAYAFSHNSLVSFTRYVSKNVVKEVLSTGGDTRNMVPTHVSVFYADIEGFTSICEALDAEVLSKTLKVYFKRMTRLVLAHGGIVDKFIGDCIQAVWGAPFKVARDELLCALCALAFRKEASRNPLKKTFAELGFSLNVRIGCASGQVLAGNMGSKSRVAYTVVGDANTTANALEPYNKTWGTYVCCSEDTARDCADELVFRLLTRAKFVGRAKPVLCYEIMGVQPDAKARTSKKKRKRGEGDVDAGSGSGSGNSGSGSGSGSGSDEGDSSSSPTSFSSDGHSRTASESEIGSSIASGSSDGADVLPTNVNLESLLKWHKKRTAADERTIAFASQFNEISRCMMDSDFEGALQRHRMLLDDDYILAHHKSHKSMEVISDLIVRALRGDNEISTNKRPLSEDGEFFVLVK